MDQSGAETQNNLPTSLQQQLQAAARQVRWSQNLVERGHHQHHRPEQRGAVQNRAPQRGTYPNRGRPRPFQPMQTSPHPPRPQQSFQNRRGQGYRGSLHQPQPFFTHQHEGARQVPQPPSSFVQGPPSTAQQPSGHYSTETHSISTDPSDSSSLTLVPSSSSPQQVTAEALPALGSSKGEYKNPPQPTTKSSHPPLERQNPITSQSSSPMSVDTRQAFFERASSGAYRGHGHTSYPPQRHVTQVPVSGFMTDQNLPARGVLLQPRIYDPATDRRLCDPNPHSQHGIHRQCQYLTFLAERETKKELNGKELLEKEAFRKRLEKIVQKLVTDYAKDHVTVNPKSVRLKCYGSLASGFAVPGSDMDLLLMFPDDQGPVGPIEVESRRMIEKALLDLGHGARLLTKTRVPILRVCQNPSPELLTNLRKEREKWEEETRQEEKERLLLASGLDPNRLPSEVTDEQSDAATVTFAELDTEPSIIPLPSSPARVHANLEYTAEVGIQCDINFSNYVAIYNTTLLRCYCKCDPRVRPMGLFVKEWSKARKINTPYHGTLSSYGYVMMVLHYLMNIAQPPVIPNLQHLARDEDAWNNRTNVELFEGFDVRFVKDEALLERRAQAGQITKNRESLGSLLRGFFRYYTDSRGFHWLNEVISIRTQGGLLTKKSKDWTESKRAGKDNSIRLRYIFAIEDPFETDHNIARTVGRSGVAAIRDELHRAWNILSMIKYGEGRWVWYQENGEEGEDLFATAHDRGDLLRQDQDYHRERMRKLNQIQRNRELEIKSGQNDKSASVESVDGRFPVFSRPSRSKDDANVSETRVIEVRSKLIDLGRVVQDVPAEKVKNLPKKLAQLGKENVNEGIDPDVTNVKGTWMDKSYDVSKWIESTAESNHSTKIDSGSTGERRPEATVSGKASQRITDIKQKISDVVCSPTDLPLRPSNSLALPKSPSIAPSKQCAPASTASEMRPCVTLDPKNPLSAWNVTTQQGRWLNWRDERVRAGKWHGISQMAKFGALDRQHPYDAARPLPDFEQQYRIVNVRAKRNQYFDVKKVERHSIDAGGSHETQVAERKDSAISMGKIKTAPARNSKPGPQSGSGKRGLPYLSVPDRKTVKAPSTSAFTSALSSNNPEVIHKSDHEIEPIVEDSLAAVGDPDGHDYRHDFPVPIAPNFPFDPAQLRDLGIIAKGGSGCARDAKEQEYGAYDHDGFRNVELSNEWGGGGRMGELATDSEELPVLDFASAEAKTFVAKGDEDGFLRELPLGW